MKLQNFVCLDRNLNLTHCRTLPRQVACGIFSIVNVYLNLVYLPFYKPKVNVFNILHGCAFMWATMCLGVAHLRAKPQVVRP